VIDARQRHVRLSVSRGNPCSFFQFIPGIGRPAKIVKDSSKLKMSLRKIRIEPDGLAQIRLGRSQLIHKLLRDGDVQIRPRRWVRRAAIEVNRLLVVVQRQLILVLVVVAEPQVVVGPRHIGIKRNGLLKVWYDRQLTAGEKWENRIVQELNEADVIVLQLSRDFLASDYCVKTELATAIRRKEKGEAELIAYVLRACDWQQVPNLAKFQILPRDAKPINRWDKNEYWVDVAKGIREALEKRHSARRES